MLWKKESSKENSLYIDLCQSPPGNPAWITEIYDKFQMETKKIQETKPWIKSDLLALEYRQKGNRFFAMNKWNEAMEWYNKSLCFAENGSEMLGLAYANRASCFFYMKMYAKFFVDIELAKQYKYPENLMEKLEKRVAKCLVLMEKEEDKSESMNPVLEYEPNEKFPCLANILKIQNNRQFGRHIIATDDIDVGKKVMVEQNYLAETFELKYKTCNICLKSDKNFKPCNKCVIALFCSDCEKNQLHDIECEINPSYLNISGIENQRMIGVRSVLLAMNAFPDINQLITVVEKIVNGKHLAMPESLLNPQSKYRAFLQLFIHSEELNLVELPKAIYFIYRTLMDHSEVATYFCTDSHKRFLMHLIGHHMVTLDHLSENISVSVAELSGHLGFNLYTKGVCMNIVASYFNHSCAPNVCLEIKDGFTICNVIRPIRKNEQLFISYVDEMKNKAERQMELFLRYHIYCTCDRCKLPFESSNTEMKMDPNFQAIKKTKVSLTDDYKIHDSMKEKCYSFLKKYGKSPWSDELSYVVKRLGYYFLLSEQTESNIQY